MRQHAKRKEALHVRACAGYVFRGVESLTMRRDTLAEWLRRRPAKPMGSPRVGSNPTGVAFRRYHHHVPKQQGCLRLPYFHDFNLLAQRER